MTDISQPKVFTYWEGEDFSPLHYYTILSLHKYNPNINITIYTTKYPTEKLVSWNSGEHSVRITNKMNFKDVLRINPDRITIKEIDFEEEYGLNNDISCVFKADFTRIVKLYEHGGMWFDMDILFTKPIPSYMFDLTGTKEMCYFTYCEAIPTGLISCKSQSTYISIIYNKAQQLIPILNRKNNENYQIIGPSLWKETFLSNQGSIKSTLSLIDTTDIYPILYFYINQLYSSESNATIPENTWGIHWYNGHTLSKQFINNFNPQNLGDSLIERYIKRILT